MKSDKNDTSRARTDDSKAVMLEALEKYKGIVTSSAHAIGIHRSTHYTWMKEDRDYALAVDEIQDVALDFVESQLLKRVEAEDTQAIIFYLKTKGRKRGYNERSPILDRSQTINIEVNEKLITHQIAEMTELLKELEN